MSYENSFWNDLFKADSVRASLALPRVYIAKWSIYVQERGTITLATIGG